MYVLTNFMVKAFGRDSFIPNQIGLNTLHIEVKDALEHGSHKSLYQKDLS